MKMDNYFWSIDTAKSCNPVEALVQCPELTIKMLEKCADFPLTDEQLCVAKLSALRLAQDSTKELTILDLVELWAQSLTLGEFAQAIKKNLLF